jgi:hypothetical protein
MADGLPPMRNVYSSSVNRIGYEGGKLFVEWVSGRTSVYEGVSPEIAETVANSWSIGRAIHRDIKPNYPHRYVDGMDQGGT